MVDAALMGVAVDHQDLAGKIRGLRAQQFEQLAVAAVRQALREMLEAGVGLHREGHAGEFFLAGDLEGCTHPGQHLRVALAELPAGRFQQAPVVVAAGDIQGSEQHRADAKARMLRVGGTLPLQGQALAPERLGLRPEQPAQGAEAFQRRIAAVRQALAIAPLVIAGDENEGNPAGVEQRAAVGEQGVVAAVLAVLDVADVDHQFAAAVGNRFQHFRQFGAFEGRVGRIADQRDPPGFSLAPAPAARAGRRSRSTAKNGQNAG